MVRLQMGEAKRRGTREQRIAATTLRDLKETNARLQNAKAVGLSNSRKLNTALLFAAISALRR
jgi:hypothetical protein